MDFGQSCIVNEPMYKHTSFKTGGCADYFAAPSTIDELVEILQRCKSNKLPYFIIGNGTNLLVSDDGYRGVIIKLCGNLSGERLIGNTIEAKCGLRLTSLSYFAMENGLSGLEFAAGIPGTVGGGVYMNAGAYEFELSNVIETVTALTDDLKIKQLTNEQMQFKYRSSLAQKENFIVLEAVFKLSPGNKEEIKNKMQYYNDKRKEKQPLEFPSAGSTFKRPKGTFAAKLIEDCGLKGFSIGGAQVSEKHAGFIINVSEATTADILAVMEHCTKTVYKMSGIMLEPEVRML